MTQKKIVDLDDIVVLKTNHRYNPYRIYKVWNDGTRHQKLITVYADIDSVICWLMENVAHIK